MAVWHAQCLFCGGLSCTCFDTDEEYEQMVYDAKAEEEAYRQYDIDRLQYTEKNLEKCREAYKSLSVLFCGSVEDNMEAAVNQHNTYATRAFVAWKLLHEVFGK